MQPAPLETKPVLAKPQADWKQYLGLVSSELDAVKNSLLAVAPPQTEVLASSVSGSLNSGGKYLRPAITLLVGQAIAASLAEKESKSSSLVEVAAVSEMIHVATLLHDDVLDDAATRRGKPTVRAELGNKISVLGGDYLLAQASLKLATLGNTRLVSIYAQVLADLCDGEVAQMKASYDLESSMDNLWKQYRHKTFCKTASLFAAGGEAAGVVYDLPEDEIQTLRGFGTAFGMAFQVVDDLLDYTSSAAEMGKPVLDDLRHGILNAPILLALSSEFLTQEEQQRFALDTRSVLALPPDEISERHLEPILTWLDKAQAVEQTQKLITQYSDEAIQALGHLSESAAKAALVSLVSEVASRKN